MKQGWASKKVANSHMRPGRDGDAILNEFVANLLCAEYRRSVRIVEEIESKMVDSDCYAMVCADLLAALRKGRT